MPELCDNCGPGGRSREQSLEILADGLAFRIAKLEKQLAGHVGEIKRLHRNITDRDTEIAGLKSCIAEMERERYAASLERYNRCPNCGEMDGLEDAGPSDTEPQLARVCLHCGQTNTNWRYNRCPNCGEMDGLEDAGPSDTERLAEAVTLLRRAEGTGMLPSDPHHVIKGFCDAYDAAAQPTERTEPSKKDLVHKFLTLPHHTRRRILTELGVEHKIPDNVGVPDYTKAFREIREAGKLDAFAQAIAGALSAEESDANTG